MILVKKSAGCKCHIPTIKVGPVSVHLLLNIYSKTRNSCVSLFRLNNETTEEKKKTLIPGQDHRERWGKTCNKRFRIEDEISHATVYSRGSISHLVFRSQFTVLTCVTPFALLMDEMLRISLFHITTISELVTYSNYRVPNNIRLN